MRGSQFMTMKTFVIVAFAAVAIIVAAIAMHHHGGGDLMPWLASIHGKH